MNPERLTITKLLAAGKCLPSVTHYRILLTWPHLIISWSRTKLQVCPPSETEPLQAFLLNGTFFVGMPKWQVGTQLQTCRGEFHLDFSGRHVSTRVLLPDGLFGRQVVPRRRITLLRGILWPHWPGSMCRKLCSHRRRSRNCRTMKDRLADNVHFYKSVRHCSPYI